MIRKLRSGLRNQTGFYSEEAYGGPLPVPDRDRNAAFPWDRFPALEKLVCDNQFSANRKSASELAALVTERSGIQVNEGAIKQRVDNNAPPAYMIAGLVHEGPLTWPELWQLGAKISMRAWKNTVFNFLNEPKRSGNKSLADIPMEKVEMLRRHVLKDR